MFGFAGLSRQKGWHQPNQNTKTCQRLREEISSFSEKDDQHVNPVLFCYSFVKSSVKRTNNHHDLWKYFCWFVPKGRFFASLSVIFSPREQKGHNEILLDQPHCDLLTDVSLSDSDFRVFNVNINTEKIETKSKTIEGIPKFDQI